MRNLIIVLIASMLSVNVIASDVTPSKIPYYILNAASTHGVDVNLMYAICTVESRCKANAINKNDGTPAEKAKGIKIKSYGLFQIKLDTAKDLGFADKEIVQITHKRGKKSYTVAKIVDHSKDLLKPEVNSYYAAKLLHKLYKKYHKTEQVISAYNAGHAIQGNPEYVLKVLKVYVSLTLDKRL